MWVSKSGTFPILQLVIHLRRLLIRRLLIRPAHTTRESSRRSKIAATDYTEVWCAGQNVPLARFADSSQSIIASGLDGLGFLPVEHVVERLRGFDSVISWYGSNRPEFRELVRVTCALPFEFLMVTAGTSSQQMAARHARRGSITGRRGIWGAKQPSCRFANIECPSAEADFCGLILQP